MALTPATNRQVPDHAILDHFNKQIYLGNSFAYSASQTSAGTSETNIYLLKNTNGVQGPALMVDLRRAACLTASHNAILRAYLNPTASAAGTPVTPINRRPGNSNAATGILGTVPTTSANGTLIEAIVVGPLTSNQSDLLWVLDPGQSLMITIQTDATSVSTVTQIGWYEI
jgi:hypothetical protein